MQLVNTFQFYSLLPSSKAEEKDRQSKMQLIANTHPEEKVQ
jgi:hypothetical protein